MTLVVRSSPAGTISKAVSSRPRDSGSSNSIRCSERGSCSTTRSTAAGRGQVRERVLDHEPRSLHRIGYEDPESRGRLVTEFAIVPGGERLTSVTQRLEYEIKGGGILSPVTDLLFIRSQMRRSLERSLGALRLEANG